MKLLSRYFPWGWGVKVEIKAISAQPTEVGVGLSWAELGKNPTNPTKANQEKQNIQKRKLQAGAELGQAQLKLTLKLV